MITSSTPVQPIYPRLFLLARIAALIAGVFLSVLAVSHLVVTLLFAIREPWAILPEEAIWNAELLKAALASFHLPAGFFAAYSLFFSLMFTSAFLVCGWLILWKKRGDWFGLYLGLILLLWADGIDVFYYAPEISIGCETLLSYLSWISWPGLFLLLFYFPSGHVKPYWVRWFTFLLSGILAITFLGSIVVMQSAFGRFTGNRSSPLVTVISTLTIAALFSPLRNRTQNWIDRRFFRAKYNAEKALAGFTGTVRDEVDLEEITTALLYFAQATMQPERVGLWLKPGKKKVWTRQLTTGTSPMSGKSRAV